jgi:hypothetical protein
MPENVRMWVEISFNVTYLVVVWSLVVMMRRRRSLVVPRDRPVADLVLWAFALLAVGDTGHVGFRVLAYGLGDLETRVTAFGSQFGLVGIGALATAITVSVFYVLVLYMWRARFEGKFDWFEYLLLAAPVVRFALMAVPANNWNSVEPVQPWSTLRNLPLMLQGLGVAYLILRDAGKAQDRTFYRIGVSILVSYACYIPVIFFVQRVPMIGMLMIPKTVAYVFIAMIAYRALFRPAEAALVTATGAGDA